MVFILLAIIIVVPHTPDMLYATKVGKQVCGEKQSEIKCIGAGSKDVAPMLSACEEKYRVQRRNGHP